ncbi:UNVERIFIED_CONTAM: protein DGS1, mitochondrial [Sesamum latifolium]|uniref:Protein DGS1, mitochondrial n=1 Tax=Sesamum latifolium TaxID=2727402 RepID=A0AAW2Y553_9LAMI
MEEQSPLPSNNVGALVSFYSSYFHNRLRTFLPLSLTSEDGLLSRIANFYGYSKRRRRKTCLPLPLPSAAAAASLDRPPATTTEACRIFDLLEDIVERTLQNLHSIQKNLNFWQSKAEGTNVRKAYFMICERGPSAFVNGTVQLIRDCLADGSSMQKLYCSASSHISERISVLTSLRYYLAAFLAKDIGMNQEWLPVNRQHLTFSFQSKLHFVSFISLLQVYTEVDGIAEDLVKDVESSVPSLLVVINDLFLKMEASIGQYHANRRSGSSVDGSYSQPLLFAKLPEVSQEGSQWMDYEIRDAINLIYDNLHRLDSYLSVLVSKHRKPRTVTLYWMRYSCAVVLGISVVHYGFFVIAS